MYNNPKTHETLTYADALLSALSEKMSEDDRVVVLGLDVDDHKGIQGSTLGLAERFGKERCFSTPLSEDAMTGIAIGLSMAGYRPIHVHIRMDFLLLCMNQLINMAAKAHYTTSGGLRVPLVVRAMIGRSWGQGAQHSQALQSLFVHIPGLKVVTPSNAHDAKGCMVSAIEDDNPVLFIEHRLLYGIESVVPKKMFRVPLGQARIMKEGTNITIVAISHMVLESLRAAQALEKMGFFCEVIDPVTLKPFDIETVFKSVNKTKRLLVVDNAWLTCGMSSEIITQVIELKMKRGSIEDLRIGRIGFAETTCPTTHVLEDEFYPNGQSIFLKALELLSAVPPKNIEGLFSGVSDELANFKGPF